MAMLLHTNCGLINYLLVMFKVANWLREMHLTVDVL